MNAPPVTRRPTPPSHSRGEGSGGGEMAASDTEFPRPGRSAEGMS
jgi:hypothetical protein